MLEDKLAELIDCVEVEMTKAADIKEWSAISTYLHHGDRVWLSVSTAGKLDAHWEERWTVAAIKLPVIGEITD